MLLAGPSPGNTADLAAAVAATLDRRLRRGASRPLALALSGGGDSVALLLAVQTWAQAAGRPLIALTVDHRLQPASAAWTEACGALATRLGVGFRPLVWEGEKPARGLPAAARDARHRLLAAAAREAGAGVLLLGHTADDVLEARAMRAAGSTTPEPRDWGPSPAWPEGRGLFLLRPLLGLRRAEIRRWLAGQNQTWIEDPANADTRLARPRARAALDLAAAAPEPAAAAPLALARELRADATGVLRLARAAFRAASTEDARRLLAMACVCAGGGRRLPAGPAVARLHAALRAPTEVVATLSGARVEADGAEAGGAEIRWLREPGEAGRGGLPEMMLAVGTPAVWDGRFELTAVEAGLQVRRLGGLSRRLPAPERRALARLPASARPGLPAVVDAEGAVSCPLLAERPRAAIRALIEDRLAAACGLIEREPA